MEAQQQELGLLIGQKEKQTEQLERLKIIEVENNNLKQRMQLLHEQNQNHLQVLNQQTENKDNQLKLLNVLNQQKDQQLQEEDQQLQEKYQQLQEKDQQLHERDQQLQEKHQQLQEKDQQLQKYYQQLQEKDQQLREKHQQLQERHQQLQEKDQKLHEKDQQLQEKHQQLQEKDQQLHERDQQLQEKHQQLQEKHQQLQEKNQQLHKKVQQLQEEHQQLLEKDQKLHEKDQQLQEKHQQLQGKDQQLRERDQHLHEKHQHLQEKDQQLHEKNEELQEKDQQIQEINRLIQTQNQELQTINQGKEEQVRVKKELEAQLHQLQQENAELKSSWVIKKKDIILGEQEVGRGAYGWVKEATFQGCRVAVKCLHNCIISHFNLGLFRREMSMAARCRHPNLLQFIGATSKGDGNPFIVTELMHRSLRQLLEHEKLSSNQIIPIMLGVALGLNYLHTHEPPILHRDVSSANVLLNPLPSNQWFAKLSDFGSVNFLHQSQTVNAGNPAYAAPEALDPKKGRHTPAMDTFSFGVLLHELCSRTHPDGKLTPENFTYADWKAPESQVVSLIISCINQEIGKRPIMNTVVAQLKAFTRS